jgi:hypothetical protein
MYATMTWLVYKVLKQDMGVRCSCSPRLTTILSLAMTGIRFFALCYGFFYNVFPRIFLHFVYTYIVVWKHIRVWFGLNASANVKMV